MSVALFIVALTYLSVPVHAQDDADVRRELEAQYKKLAAAHDRKDLKAIIALKTSDFHAFFTDGRVGDSKLMEQYSRDFLQRNQPPFNLRFTIQTLDGWKLKSVDNVRDQKKFVDGQRVDPAKPYNPDDPPYNPDDAGAKKQ